MQGRPEEKPIAFLMLRTMQKARYDVANLGHFGLAAPSYTHFTSPIRRYPDLLVHRALRASRAADAGRGRSVPNAWTSWPRWRACRRSASGAPTRRSASCSSGSRSASWPTRSARSSRATSPASPPFGLFVELADHFVEGLVHVSSMSDDYYRYLERAHQLRGEHTQRAYRLGDRVRVRVARADLERRQIDLVLDRRAGARPASSTGARPAGGRRRRRANSGSRRTSPRRAAAARRLVPGSGSDRPRIAPTLDEGGRRAAAGESLSSNEL